MPHNHSHDHGHVHHHAHSAKDYYRAFTLGVVLNFAYVVIEAAFGLITGSLALLADAGHNLSDVLGLVLAWAAAWLAKRRPSSQFTYGLRGSSILAALANAGLLLLACGAIAWEALQRYRHPLPIAADTVIWIASIGILVNGFTAWLFAAGRKHDLNLRAAFQHMSADALISVGVVVSAILMRVTNWHWLDPTVSLVIVAIIVAGTWGLLRDALRLALNAVPPGIDAAGVERYLRTLPGVSDIHDLHIWGMSTTEAALTVHLIMPTGHPKDQFLREVAHQLEHRFGVHHATLQIELGDDAQACALAPSDVV